MSDLLELARRVRTAAHALAEAEGIAATLSLPTYLRAPLMGAAVKATMVAATLEREVAALTASTEPCQLPD